MKDVSIERMMMAWNKNDSGYQRPGGKAGQMAVCEHPDNGQVDHLMFWNAPFQDLPERTPAKADQRIIFLKLKMMVEAWHIACRDGVPLKNIHEALIAVPEYRQLLALDFKVIDGPGEKGGGQ